MNKPINVRHKLKSLDCGCTTYAVGDVLEVVPCPNPQHEEMLLAVSRAEAARLKIPVEVHHAVDN